MKHELQGDIGHRDNKVDPPTLILFLNVVAERLGGLRLRKAIRLQVLCKIVDGFGRREEHLANCSVTAWIDRKFLGTPVDDEHRSAGLRLRFRGTDVGREGKRERCDSPQSSWRVARQ